MSRSRPAKTSAANPMPIHSHRTAPEWSSLIDVTLAIGAKRKDLLNRLRAAVLAGDHEGVFNIAEQLVGGRE